MSDTIVRDYNFSVRLSQPEKVQLEQLAAQLDLDKSAAVRRAVGLTLTRLRPLPCQGYFVALGNAGSCLPLHLSRKDDSER